MAVAHIGGVASATSAANPFTFNSGNWTPAGVVVFVVVLAATVDEVTGVTYGGVAMTSIPTLNPAIDTAGEAGSVEAFFLGSGIPTGVQTISVANTAGKTKIAYAFAVSGAADTEIVANARLQGDQADPHVPLDSGSVVAQRYCCIFSGLASPTNLSLWAGTSSSGLATDHGQTSSRADFSTSAVSGSADIGYSSSLTSDDVAMVAVAVAEVAGGGGATSIPELVMAPYRPA